MAVTYEAIDTVSLGSSSSQINFTGIPQTYTDLRVIFTYSLNSGANFAFLRFNSSGSSVYGQQNSSAFGASSRFAYRTSSQTQIWLNYNITAALGSTSEYLSCIIDIFDYTSNKKKYVLTSTGRAGNSGGTIGLEKNVGIFDQTTAITSIQLSASSNLFTGTRATIYGILRA